MKKDTLIYTITAILTVGFSLSAVIMGVNLHSHAIAKKQLNSQTQLIVTDNEHLKSRQDILTSDIKSKTDSTDEKDKLNNRIAGLKEDIGKADADIKAKNQKADELTSQIDDIKKVVDKLNEGVNQKKGDAITLRDTTVLSGDKLGIGRYIATGSGSFSISSIISGTLLSADLSQVDSYTFDLEGGERITVHGSVTFTELK